MNYEQKYKEALKSMIDLYNKMKHLSSTDALATAVTLEKAFPELAESEDERIRKELISAFTVTADKREHEIYGHGITYGQVLAWLEKQDEQPTWSEEDEKMLNKTINELIPYGECPDYPSPEEQEYYYTRTSIIDWLKSLKPNQAMQDFLEKTCEWLEDQACYYSHWEYNGDTYEKEIVVDTDKMIEQFKNYMQNEDK